jgi:ATP-binding cassette subfamily B protein
LRGATLEVRRGERILLSGASGGGKSTLIALLAGLRRPHSGLLLAGGLDLPTLGAAGFRRRIALAPQFHQNHVFTGPLSFNLLMGHRDPWSDGAQADALAICRELGLAPLLERMPGGMGQMVGETGWQLSHGERSRIFLARALLQGAPVVVLDESLGALDPESFDLALDCLAKRAQSLILVAHP